MEPLVSVVVICYNGEKYLSTCFDALLEQTYKKLEVIIVNDGSTDDSLNIMNSYSEKFKKNNMLFKIFTQKNGGMSAALNSGLKLITGDYFLWCDCDDYYEEDAIESLLNFLMNNQNIDIVRGKCRVIDYESKKVLRIKGPKDKLNLNVFDSLMFETDSYCNCGVNMTTTKYLDKCIKDREIYINRAGQNWQLLLPFSYYGNFGFLDKVVYNYNYISSSHSHSMRSLKKEFEKYNAHKDILYHIVDSLELMPSYDKKMYKKRIDYKYTKKKLKLIMNRIRFCIHNKSIPSHFICDHNSCIGCGSCSLICKNSAIRMQDNDEGFKYPIIDNNKCTNCGQCSKICPVLNEESKQKDIKAYACYNKDDKERINSSSGGIFILLAKEIIKQGGIVFGACFDQDYKVVHDYADNEKDLEKFMTSKYVQSDLKDSFLKVEEFLKNNKIVYFSGTPCQVEALRSFLRKDYDNLILQDIICHGVPSPKVWEKYKEYRMTKDSNKPISINFRQKDEGWESYSIYFKYDGSKYEENHCKDLYMKPFLKNTSLRESCYNCQFKALYRNSDITLGDFWGIDKVISDFNDDKGVSAILINSQKGNRIFDTLKNKIECRDVNYLDIVKYNTSLIKSSQSDYSRDDFFRNIDKVRFEKLISKYVGKDKFIKKLIRKVL